METISGTTSSPVRGYTWTPAGEPIALEPGGSDLSCTVTVQAGADIERMHVVEGEPQGAWRVFSAGESFDVAGGERVVLRPRGGGGAGCTFAWRGAALDALRDYKGAKGTDVSWR